KKQQMQWSKEGAHLLLQTRVRTLNGELGAIFKRWYPDMDLEVEEIPIAAYPPASPCSLWERRALTGEPPQGLIGPDDRLRCMWPHHALRRPPIAWHARDM